jgi:hypothetical protein
VAVQFHATGWHHPKIIENRRSLPYSRTGPREQWRACLAPCAQAGLAK